LNARPALALLLVLVLTACAAPVTPTALPTPRDGLGLVETPNPQSLAIAAKRGHLAPDFILHDETGKPVRLSDLRGAPVLLNFWATWCGPCKAEMPEFQQLSGDGTRPLVVVAVNANETPSLVNGFKREMGITFPTPIDRGSRVAQGYGIFGLPASFVLDAEGVIRDVRLGPYFDRQDIEASLAKGGFSGTEG
jgi:thiol-disulfide isomerase/thioredoxin